MKGIFLFVILSSMNTALAKPSFDEDWSRYPSPPALFGLLKSVFPNSFVMCQYPRDPSILGENDPSEGEPAFHQPSPAFLVWWSACLSHIARNEAVVSKTRYWDTSLQGAIPQSPDGWTGLEPDLKSKLILAVADRLYGPGLVEDEEALVKIVCLRIDKKLTDTKAYPEMVGQSRVLALIIHELGMKDVFFRIQ